MAPAGTISTIATESVKKLNKVFARIMSFDSKEVNFWLVYSIFPACLNAFRNLLFWEYIKFTLLNVNNSASQGWLVRWAFSLSISLQTLQGTSEPTWQDWSQPPFHNRLPARAVSLSARTDLTSHRPLVKQWAKVDDMVFQFHGLSDGVEITCSVYHCIASTSDWQSFHLVLIVGYSSWSSLVLP